MNFWPNPWHIHSSSSTDNRHSQFFDRQHTFTVLRQTTDDLFLCVQCLSVTRQLIHKGTMLTAGVRRSLLYLLLKSETHLTTRDYYSSIVNSRTQISAIFRWNFFEVIRNFDTFTQRFLAGPLMAFSGTLVGKHCPILTQAGSQVTYKNIRREVVLKAMMVVLLPYFSPVGLGL